MELPTAFSGPFANEVDGSQVSESREIGFAMRELLVERVKRLVGGGAPRGRARAPPSQPLELRASRKGENRRQPVEESSAAPLVPLDLAQVLQILREDLLELDDDGRVVDDLVEFLVERE